MFILRYHFLGLNSPLSLISHSGRILLQWMCQVCGRKTGSWLWWSTSQSNFPVSTCPDAGGHYWTSSRQDRANVTCVERNGVWLPKEMCDCSNIQTMSHIVDSCPPTKLDGGLQRLHTADEASVDWLTLYGTYTHMTTTTGTRGVHLPSPRQPW